jgi:hypothetical protein
MASGHMNRVKRPDTWLHRPMLQNVKKVLANPEPSTHDPTRTWALISLVQKSPGRCRGFESLERLIEIRIDVLNATSWPLEGIATTS